MKNYIILIFIINFICACSTNNNNPTNIEKNDLVNGCIAKSGEVSIFSLMINKQNEQIALFGDVLPENVIPVFLCISNETDNIYGFNDKDFFLTIDNGENNNNNIFNYSSTPESQEKGTLSTASVGLLSTALIGLVPGILIASSHFHDVSREVTETNLKIVNNKITSGIIYPKEKKYGFIYFEMSNEVVVSNVDSFLSYAKLLNLKNKDQILLTSKLETLYRKNQ